MGLAEDDEIRFDATVVTREHLARPTEARLNLTHPKPSPGIQADSARRVWVTSSQMRRQLCFSQSALTEAM